MSKITENKLRQVIREERSKILTESDLFDIVLEETVAVLREQDLEDKAEKVVKAADKAKEKLKSVDVKAKAEKAAKLADKAKGKAQAAGQKAAKGVQALRQRFASKKKSGEEAPKKQSGGFKRKAAAAVAPAKALAGQAAKDVAGAATGGAAKGAGAAAKALGALAGGSAGGAAAKAAIDAFSKGRAAGKKATDDIMKEPTDKVAGFDFDKEDSPETKGSTGLLGNRDKDSKKKKRGRQKMNELNKGVLMQMIQEQIDEMCGVKPPMHSPMKKSDHEGSMARQQMYKTMNYAQELYDNIPEDAELPAWVQSKMTKVADYIGAVKHYLEYEYKHDHGRYHEGLQEQDEIEIAGGAVTVDVDTKALAAKIREILPTEAQKDKETMEQLFSDLRSLMDQPATGATSGQPTSAPTNPIAQPAQ